MPKQIIELDLGENLAAARQFKREQAEMSLNDFLGIFAARFTDGNLPDKKTLALCLKDIVFQPITIAVDSGETSADIFTATLPVSENLRNTLDQLWFDELRDDEFRPDERSDIEFNQMPQKASDPDPEDSHNFPERLSDNEAVRCAYREEMDSISDYLRHRLSVLVKCDKMLTEYLYELVCHQAGKKPVLDAARPEEMRRGIAGELDRTMQGGYSNLPLLLRNLKTDEVLILRSLDLVDEGATIETLYERTSAGEKPQLLAFLDPSLEVKKVLSDRFAVHIQINGLPRYPSSVKVGAKEFTVSRLLTRRERERFADFDPEALFKNVSGLNALQFRNAMHYVGAKVAPQSPAKAIYREIREFKITSGSEVEVPDTTFADIGGYDHIKRQLKHAIALIAGDIKSLDDEQRGKLLPRGFIFHGPPGTGKTLFAKAVANELNATIQMISGPEIMDKYVGQSENNLRQLFATARRNAPAVIFFDEFDSIASQRSIYADGGARANNAVVAQLLTEMDGFRRDQAVLVIGTSNRIDIIDEALLRPSRLRPVEIGLPDLEARRQVARIHARSFAIDSYFQEFRQNLKKSDADAESHELQRLLSQLADQGIALDDFINGLIDLIAIHSDGFNNDEIRAVFQEASLEHHLEGRVLSPRFFGSKLAALKRRRQERSHRHL
ncbi:MAG: 26S protease regulatory subunit [Deltaproteobacteria bacterium]|nr:26S protease regulatory subunit [Deltaproteobacteria bacterium]